MTRPGEDGGGLDSGGRAAPNSWAEFGRMFEAMTDWSREDPPHRDAQQELEAG